MKALLIRFLQLLLIAVAMYSVSRLLASSKWNWFWELCTQSSRNSYDAQLISTNAGIISAVVLGPIVEEYLFRYGGFRIIRKLAPTLSIPYSLFLTSLIFCFAHYQYWMNGIQWQNLLYVFLDGLVYGGVYLARGKIADSIVIHASVNLLIIVPKDKIFGEHCAQFGGWNGGLVLVSMIVFFVFAVIVMTLNLRQEAKISGNSEMPLSKFSSNVLDRF